MRTQQLELRTPEGIRFSLPLAGPMTRLLAWSVDAACILTLTSLVGAAGQGLTILSSDAASALGILSYFGLSIGYGMACEWFWRGQTLGKRVLRLRVIDERGLRLQPSQVVLRNLLRAVDILPLFYLVGGAALLCSRKAQRLGDFAAGTVVVRTAPVAVPDLAPLLSGKFNSLREHPRLAARLRQRAGAEEASLALQAVLRRNEMEPGARAALFAEIAAHFRALVEFPPEATSGLADEQYTLDVVDILFRARDEGMPFAPDASILGAGR